jgi:hypothetical protein
MLEKYMGKYVKVVYSDRGFEVAKKGIVTEIINNLICFEMDDKNDRCIHTDLILKIELIDKESQ